MDYKYDISVVVPLFNEAESLPELYAWIKRVMQANGFSFEIIFGVPLLHEIRRTRQDSYRSYGET